MSRKQPKRRAGNLTSIVVAGFFILVIACGVGFSAASADPSDDLVQAGAFGFDEATHEATRATAADGESSIVAIDAASFDQQTLATTSARDISAGLAMVDEWEAAEQARVEADNIAVFDRVDAEKAKQGVTQETSTEPPAPEDMEYNLPTVDWSCGHDAFVAEWTERIDAYLEGSNLAGYGSVFAEAAWENGVDPRWSPAISNTESGKGKVCFRPHNAWGWGNSGWSDWDTAIREHVAGLGRVYGYSITRQAAAIYCPPGNDDWYYKTIGQMELI